MEKFVVNTEENLRLICGEYREKFEAFRAYLLEFNEKYNLTAITGEKDVTYKHFLDSAAARELFFQGVCRCGMYLRMKAPIYIPIPALNCIA